MASASGPMNPDEPTSELFFEVFLSAPKQDRQIDDIAARRTTSVVSWLSMEHLRAIFWNYGSTPPTVLRPVPLQPSSPKRMNFWIRFPVSTSAVYRLPWESMLTW